MPVALESRQSPEDLRKRYGVPAGRVIIASMGFGSSAKRIEMVLGALGALGRNDILYLLVGEVGEAFRVELSRLGLGDLVRSTGYVDCAGIQRLLQSDRSRNRPALSDDG